MRLVGVALAALASVVAGEKLENLDTSLTILTNNDLQGRLRFCGYAWALKAV